MIPLLEKRIFLGYIPGYLPFSCIAGGGQQTVRLPFRMYEDSTNQSTAFICNNEIESDTGIIIIDRTPMQKEAYNLSSLEHFRTTYVYQGKDALYPFTLSPYEFIDIEDQNFQKKPDKDLEVIKAFFKDQIPKTGEINFIHLPVTTMDKDIFELLFLEELIKNVSQNKDIDVSNIFHRMINYIELETGNKIDEIVKGLHEQLTQDQLKIIEEQENLSKNVIENKIKGKNKKKNSAKKTKDKKNKKQPNNKTSATKDFKEFQKTLEQKKLSDKLKNAGKIKYRKMLNVVNKSHEACC